MFYLKPPRHISTLPIASLWGRPVLAQSGRSREPLSGMSVFGEDRNSLSSNPRRSNFSLISGPPRRLALNYRCLFSFVPMS